MKKILGLDLGTNSIGWALVDKEAHKILGMGSRIIPMGADKLDYEKGIGITKNATRREKRTARKMNKRYKLRRNKLLFILNTLGILPDQFQFKDGIPESNKLQQLELLPIKKGTLQLDSLGQYGLCVKALENKVELKEFGKILYKFNQLRGYSGGDNDDKAKKKQNEEDENKDDVKTYEVISQKVEILSVEKSEETFTVRGGKNKGEKQNYYTVTIKLDDEEKEGKTELQNLEEKVGQEEELEIRIRRNKKTGEETSVVFALPQKSNWRKAMETDEKILKEDNLFISELRLRDLNQDKWIKIRNRVFLRNRYKEEFDKVWDTQAQYYPILSDCPKGVLGKIANYIFPGESESQQKLRKQAIDNGLKYIIKEQVIYYQRPLKPQTELISNCRFEKEKKVIASSHPLFQEFRCWKQINNLYITSKQEVYSENKKKNVFQYIDRYLTNEQKQELYKKLQVQKQVGFNEVRKIVGIKDDKTEYLNGLNVKAKLIGCDTSISIKKVLGDTFIILDSELVEEIWEVIFDVRNHDGSEYDAKSKRVLPVIEILLNYTDQKTATELALKLVQNVKFPRKYASLSAKAIQNILPLMQLNPQSISEQIKNKFENIKHLIETGEIVDNVNYGLEEYVIDSVKNNPNILETGGLMEYLAISLVYGKHTTETIKAEVKNYHDIKYRKRNLRNPIVEQLSNETMQVIKAIWKEHKFNSEELEIRVELARDLKNSAAEREKIWNGQQKNKTINDKAKERLQEDNIALTSYNILKYRLYKQQKHISPYTGKTIEFSKLFDDKEYDVDHILPKSRYYDDSFSNKVVSEKNINEEKSNKTAWEYISQQNSKYKILSIKDFIDHVNKNFYGKKKKNLLAEKIPTNPVERQLKDTQYISVAIKNELAKIVGSENVKTSTGEVTDFLRSRWGLKKLFMELTESRFKQMELWDLDKDGNPKTNWIIKYYDQEKQKHIYEIKNWSKRYDNRHHAIDALIVALTEQSYIQRLNNLNKYVQDELTNRKDEFEIVLKDDETILDAFFNFEEKRRDEILQEMESSRYFEKPFSYMDNDGSVKSSLIKQVREHLETMIVSIKPKDKLGVSVDEFDKNTPNKQLKKQIKIRGALHQETYYGQLKGRDTKRVELSSLSITRNKTTKKEEVVELIDKVLASEIITHRYLLDENGRAVFQSTKEAFTGEGLKMFNDKRIANNKQPVYKVKVWYNKEEKKESSLQRLYNNNEKQSVITGGNYLFLVMEKETRKGMERVFDIASLYDSVNIAKDALKEDISDFKRKIAEDYRLSYGERNKVRGKIQDNPNRVLFTLQQNELVYLPTDEEEKEHFLRISNNEFKEWIVDCSNKREFCKRVYKVVKFTGRDCYFIPHNYANTISVAKDLSEEDNKKLKEQYGEKKIPKKELNFVEFGSYRDCSPYDSLHKKNKSKIQDMCIKIQIDWLGNITIVPQF